MSIVQPTFYSLKMYGRPNKGCKIDKKSGKNVNIVTTVLFIKLCGRPCNG